MVSAFEIAYRPGFSYPDVWLYVLLVVPLVALNGLVHFRLLTNRPVTWRWMLLLSALDIALATSSISISIGPGFDSYVFVAYYPALALFAVAFTSLWLSPGLDDDDRRRLYLRIPDDWRRPRHRCGR